MGFARAQLILRNTLACGSYWLRFVGHILAEKILKRVLQDS
jgi:hypothetical protein